MKQFKSNNKEFLAIEQGKFEELAKGILHEDIMAKKLKPVLVTNNYTEEEAERVVESYGLQNGYRNYLVSEQFAEFLKKTATESFQSRMESIDCPIVNKYDSEYGKLIAKQMNGIVIKKEFDETISLWNEEQRKIKNYIILEKK